MKGGKREGAGRKPAPDPLKSRSIRFTDSEWKLVKAKAKTNQLSASEYIRNKVLEG